MFNTLQDIYFPVFPKVVTKGYEPVLLEIRPTFFLLLYKKKVVVIFGPFGDKRLPFSETVTFDQITTLMTRTSFSS